MFDFLRKGSERRWGVAAAMGMLLLASLLSGQKITGVSLAADSVGTRRMGDAGSLGANGRWMQWANDG
jgi:hypothetical protein